MKYYGDAGVSGQAYHDAGYDPASGSELGDESFQEYPPKPPQNYRPTGSQGVNPQDPPVKELRTYRREGTTIIEEYERLNPDGTVTKAVSVGDKRDGLKQFNVYKMDKSGIVRRVKNPSPEAFFAGQSAPFGAAPSTVVAQPSEGARLTPPPTMQEQLIALKNVVKDASIDVQAAAFDDYKERLIQYGTKKLEKVLRKKLEEDFMTGKNSISIDKTDQLMNYGMTKLHNLLNKTLNKEKFLSGELLNTGSGSDAVKPSLSFVFHPTNNVNGVNSGESRPKPLTFSIRPEEVAPQKSTSSENRQDMNNTIWRDVNGVNSSTGDLNRPHRMKRREENNYDEDDYDDNVRRLKKQEFKEYVRQEAKRDYTPRQLDKKAEVYDFAIDKVNDILSKKKGDGEDAVDSLKTLEKDLKKMMRERDSDDVPSKRRQQRDEYMGMVFKELRDIVKGNNSEGGKSKKNLQFEDLLGDEILDLADKKLKKMIKKSKEEEEVSDYEFEKTAPRQSSSMRRKQQAANSEQSEEDERTWIKLNITPKEENKSSSVKETKPSKWDFETLMSKFQELGTDKPKNIDAQPEKKVKRPLLDFDSFLTQIKNGLGQESKPKPIPQQMRQNEYDRVQPKQTRKIEQPSSLGSLLDKIRQQSTKTNVGQQQQQISSSSQFSPRTFTNAGSVPPRQVEKTSTDFESLISNIYKMNNAPADQSRQSVKNSSFSVRPQVERPNRGDDDDDKVTFQIQPQNNTKPNQSPAGGLGHKNLSIGNINNGGAIPWWFDQGQQPEPNNEKIERKPSMKMPSFPSFGDDSFFNDSSFINQSLGGSLFSNPGSLSLGQ